MNYVWETIRLVPISAAVLATHVLVYRQNSEHSCVIQVFDRRLAFKLVSVMDLINIIEHVQLRPFFIFRLLGVLSSSCL